MLKQIESIVFFVADVDAAAHWYADMFDVAVQYKNRKYAFIQTPYMRIDFQPIDAKAPGGVGGTTVFWQVDHVAFAMDSLIARGAQRQRGPYVSDTGATIAIVVDPFGCALGLSGA